jgi:nicotinamide riboside transporter PnuC
MDWMQLFIVVTGLTGQILVARKSPVGFMCWIAGNMALIKLFAEQSLYWMVGLYFIYTLICFYGLYTWGAEKRPTQF